MPAPAPIPDHVVPLSKLPHFDPRAVPVDGIDTHLPAVPPEALTARALRARFAHPPIWEPELRAEHKFADRAPAHASVLVPVVMRERPTVLLTERTTHLSTHSGQVAFPGGKRDPTDADEAHTALREALEEIGLDPSHAEVIGLMPTYTTGTRFIITPVVALVSPDHEIRLNAFEVADAFEVPLEFLMAPGNHQRLKRDWKGIERQYYAMPFNDRYIWGVTAGILRNLYERIYAG
jgi:8-oxo-dGTP pyrophosphatase MutT (NUDIX family)